MSDPILTLGDRFRAVLDDTDPILRRSQHEGVDYQANVAMSLGKRVGRPPREVAADIVDQLDVADVCARVEVAGPGFINLTLRDDFLARALDAGDRVGVALAEPTETVVIDYSSPNLAKEMHVGHLRSTLIGDALARVLDFVGHHVVRQNHLGDWGTQFGMLVEHMVEVGADAAGTSLADLNVFYQTANDRFRSDPEFAGRARQRVVALQSGDEETLVIWRAFVTESLRHVKAVYAQLGVTLRDDDVMPESGYNDRLPELAAWMEEMGLARVDDGALCAFPAGFANREGEPLPLIVRKSDGGYGYATTDLAGLRYRVQELGGERLVYVVGSPQSQHLAMVFAVGEQAGWIGDSSSRRSEHVAFGNVLGPDGKMFKTRSGTNVKLTELLGEAVERAAAVVAEKSSDLDEAARAEVARMVGIGAVKYADLSNDRIKDYVFDWDRMLSFDGNSAPYLQYAHARICSIFRRAEVLEAGVVGGAITLIEPAERTLALELVSFDQAIQATVEHLQPHRLCTYLFDVASAFTTFFEHCPVLRAGTDELRVSRLALCAQTARTLELGLSLLGIEAPSRM